MRVAPAGSCRAGSSRATDDFSLDPLSSVSDVWKCVYQMLALEELGLSGQWPAVSKSKRQAVGLWAPGSGLGRGSGFFTRTPTRSLPGRESKRRTGGVLGAVGSGCGWDCGGWRDPEGFTGGPVGPDNRGDGVGGASVGDGGSGHFGVVGAGAAAVRQQLAARGPGYGRRGIGFDRRGSQECGADALTGRPAAGAGCVGTQAAPGQVPRPPPRKERRRRGRNVRDRRGSESG